MKDVLSHSFFLLNREGASGESSGFHCQGAGHSPFCPGVVPAAWPLRLCSCPGWAAGLREAPKPGRRVGLSYGHLPFPRWPLTRIAWWNIRPRALQGHSEKNWEFLRIQAVVCRVVVKWSKWISERRNLLEENIAVNDFHGGVWLGKWGVIHLETSNLLLLLLKWKPQLVPPFSVKLSPSE